MSTPMSMSTLCTIADESPPSFPLLDLPPALLDLVVAHCTAPQLSALARTSTLLRRAALLTAPTLVLTPINCSRRSLAEAVATLKRSKPLEVLVVRCFGAFSIKALARVVGRLRGHGGGTAVRHTLRVEVGGEVGGLVPGTPCGGWFHLVCLPQPQLHHRAVTRDVHTAS